MADIFTEATNNIRAMHDIESILRNDDIPADSRSYFLQFINTSLRHKQLSAKQQKNVEVFRELFARIDRDMRMFRDFLDMAVNLAEHFKFENTSIVYAFRNISLEDHFTNFIDFARRRNPIIEKDSPLQLFLTLGISIIKLAFRKNQIEMRQKQNDENRQRLVEQFRELSRNMSERFINMDFGDVLSQQQKQDHYAGDLDDLNNDQDEEDEETSVQITTVAQVHRRPETVTIEDVIEEEPPAQETPELSVLAVQELVVKDAAQELVVKEDFNDILRDITVVGEGDDDEPELLKTLDNGDKELDLQELDTLVRNLGPAVMQQMRREPSPPPPNREPSVRFVDFGSSDHTTKALTPVGIGSSSLDDDTEEQDDILGGDDIREDFEDILRDIDGGPPPVLDGKFDSGDLLEKDPMVRFKAASNVQNIVDFISSKKNNKFYNS